MFEAIRGRDVKAFRKLLAKGIDVNAPPPGALAKRLAEFCPDIIDQSLGSVTELTKALGKDRRFLFWWD